MVFGISKIHTNADFTFSNNNCVNYIYIDLTIIFTNVIIHRANQYSQNSAYRANIIQ